VLRKYFTIFIAMICTYLLQHHSVPFWQTQADSINIGLMWSITIEIVALWLWLNRKMFLASLASLIIIFVPLYQLSKPLLIEIKKVNKNTELSKLNNLDLEVTKQLQDKYLKTNWAGDIKKNTNHFRNAINDQKELLIQSSKLKRNYETMIIISLQGAIIIVIFFAQILSFRMLSFRNIEKPETANFENFEELETSEISETTSFEKHEKPKIISFESSESSENKAEMLLYKIDRYKNTYGIKQSEMAEKLNVPSSTFSKLRNRINGKGEALSVNKIEELEEKFTKYAS